MKDTKAYIREMKQKLPDIRERLIAVVILLALSVTMMVSTTWFLSSAAFVISLFS